MHKVAADHYAISGFGAGGMFRGYFILLILVFGSNLYLFSTCLTTSALQMQGKQNNAKPYYQHAREIFRLLGHKEDMQKAQAALNRMEIEEEREKWVPHGINVASPSTEKQVSLFMRTGTHRFYSDSENLQEDIINRID